MNGPHKHICSICGKPYDCAFSAFITHCHAGERYPAKCYDCLRRELAARAKQGEQS